LKEKDIIMVRVIGQRFELNDPFVSVIAELELKHERESRSSVTREIENAQKKGNPLSVILEENSDMLGEFRISSEAAAAAAAAVADKEPEEGEELEEPEGEGEELEEPEGGEEEGKEEGGEEGESKE
jgi:neurofilament light polypeptide